VLKIGEGDSIETGADSRALLVFSPEATAELGSYTEALVSRLILADNGPATIELEILRGETWHQLSSLLDPKARYEAVTPSATVILAAGRHHVTVGDDGSTRVQVSEGMARVRAVNSEVEVWAGEYTAVLPGRAPAVPRRLVARFLFVLGRGDSADIWLLDEEGQEFQLTYDEANDLAPAWSPDGSRIAFETMRDGNSEIYVMNADGSNQMNITHHPADDHAAAWSPDGTRIAFESLRDGGRDIYVMNADGTEQVRLTFSPGLSFAPSWSTQGSTLVHTRIEADSNGDGLIDLRDMANFFCLAPESESQSCWGRMIYDQIMFPWGRRSLG